MVQFLDRLEMDGMQYRKGLIKLFKSQESLREDGMIEIRVRKWFVSVLWYLKHSAGTMSRFMWIGLVNPDRSQSTGFKWADGTNYVHESWHPSIYVSDHDYCFDMTGDGTIYDTSCSETSSNERNYVCQFDCDNPRGKSYIFLSCITHHLMR